MTTSAEKKAYILDTNVLFGFSKWLPITLHSNFWAKLAESLRKKEWILLDVVVAEIKYDDDLLKWCKERKKESLISEVTDQHRERGVEINNQYKMIDETTQKSTVDTYLIAYAEANGMAVFSQENPRIKNTDLYKIPDVCDILKIPKIKRPIVFLEAIGFKN